jgi:hypothetical protein
MSQDVAYGSGQIRHTKLISNDVEFPYLVIYTGYRWILTTWIRRTESALVTFIDGTTTIKKDIRTSQYMTNRLASKSGLHMIRLNCDWGPGPAIRIRTNQDAYAIVPDNRYATDTIKLLIRTTKHHGLRM